LYLWRNTAAPVAALALLDSPVVLAAQIWTLMLGHFAPGAFAPLALASRRLQGGAATRGACCGRARHRHLSVVNIWFSVEP